MLQHAQEQLKQIKPLASGLRPDKAEEVKADLKKIEDTIIEAQDSQEEYNRYIKDQIDQLKTKLLRWVQREQKLGI